MKKQYLFYQLCFLILVCASIFSCKKYLAVRPDKTQVVPATAQDLQALLDNVALMNRNFPSYGEAATDEYYFTQADYNALAIAQDKTLYTWQSTGVVVDGQWQGAYQVVYYANQVLESAAALSAAQAAPLKGAALFFRGYAFLQITSLFSKPYDPLTAATDPGIPIRLSPDFNAVSIRGTNQQTYSQILSDLKQSITLLPVTSSYPSRPNRVAAYAAISRTLLSMGEYDQAALYADSCLSFQPPLINFNSLSTTAANPFARFNPETIFYALSVGSSLLVPSKAKIDSSLFASYAVNDLRKTIYFKSNGNGSYAFKGNYDGAQSSVIFSGLTSDEVWLTSAECYARAGNTSAALSALNTLLVTRWKKGTFLPFTAPDSQTALSLILTERKKELVYRGTRWTDLRRLNRETAFATTLKRTLGQQVYQLPPGDPRYAFLIPQEVITLSGIAQNAR